MIPSCRACRAVASRVLAVARRVLTVISMWRHADLSDMPQESLGESHSRKGSQPTPGIEKAPTGAALGVLGVSVATSGRAGRGAVEARLFPVRGGKKKPRARRGEA